MPLPADARWAHAVAALLGRPQLGYQADVCRDLSQPNLAGTGYAHPTAVVLMPRQTGKTTTLFVLAVARMMHRAGYAAAYTAQTGHTVTERFTDPGGWLDLVEGSPLGDRHHTRRSQGTERVTNTRTGSYLKAFPPRPGKLRSNALDLVVLDECQEHDWQVGRALDADVGPVFATRPLRQLILCGTAAGPGWWRSKVDAARRGDHLLLEVGTWPADADVEDPATWHAHHPGLRAGLTDEGHLASQLRDLGPAAFAREYGNRWDDDATIDQVIPLTAWDACTPAVPVGTPVAAAFDVSPDRSRCSLVVVTDAGHVRLVDQGDPRTLPAMLTEWAAGLPVHCLKGQTGTADDLVHAGHHVVVDHAGIYQAACQQLHDAVVDGRVHHDHQPQLREAWQVAARSWHGDAWVMSARRSGGDITPAVAAALAWTHARTTAAAIY